MPGPSMRASAADSTTVQDCRQHAGRCSDRVDRVKVCASARACSCVHVRVSCACVRHVRALRVRVCHVCVCCRRVAGRWSVSLGLQPR